MRTPWCISHNLPYANGKFLLRFRGLHGRSCQWETVVLQGTYLCWMGSQWSIRSWSKIFLHNVLNEIHCRWLYLGNWSHICQMDGNTKQGTSHITEKVANMMLSYLTKLLQQHHLLL
jgi:hypothetical protein